MINRVGWSIELAASGESRIEVINRDHNRSHSSNDAHSNHAGNVIDCLLRVSALKEIVPAGKYHNGFRRCDGLALECVKFAGADIVSRDRIGHPRQDLRGVLAGYTAVNISFSGNIRPGSSGKKLNRQ